MATALSLGEAQAGFAVNLLREAVKADLSKSVIISPLSVSIALSMAYAGAKDKTADEIANMIAKGQKSEKIHEYFGAMIQKITSNEPKKYTLETANRIYVKQAFPLLQSYKDLLNDHYLSQFQSVDFTKSTEAAKTINGFVAEKTHDKIKDLIKASSLNELTRLVLINAIYFKGNWASKFNAKLTEKKPFYQSEGKEIQVDMMQKSHDAKVSLPVLVIDSVLNPLTSRFLQFIYSETETYQVLGMPYEGKEVFMFIILPKERHGLQAVLQGLSGPDLFKIVKNRQRSDVMVSIPKFKIESTHSLVEHLKKLGMRQAFIDGQANFAGITGSSNLVISNVIQKAFIEANEEGTEAAAATGIIDIEQSFTPSFVADHPFLFFLARSDGDVLFAGRFNGQQ